MEQLFNQLLRPKLRNFILDLYKDVSYILDEDTYATAEYQDIVRKRFIKSWEILIDGYKVFTANHLQEYISYLIFLFRNCSPRQIIACSLVSPLILLYVHGRSLF